MATSRKTVKAVEPKPEQPYVPFTADTAKAEIGLAINGDQFDRFYKETFEPRLKKDMTKTGRAEVWILDEERPFISRTIDRLRSYGFKARRSITWPLREIVVQVPKNPTLKPQKTSGTSVNISMFGRSISLGFSGSYNWKKWFLIFSGMGTLALILNMYIMFLIFTGLSIYAFRKM